MRRRSILKGLATAAAAPVVSSLPVLRPAAAAERSVAGVRLQPTFEETFKALSLYDEGSKQGRWRTQFGYGGPDSHDSRCTAAGSTCYTDAVFTGGRYDPFSLQKGGPGGVFLRIAAAKTPDDLKARCFGKDHVSGAINTKFSFFQQYGYFEIVARLPGGKGCFPAFWGLPKDNSWSTEIDVFESLGERDLVHLGLAGGKQPALSVPAKLPFAPQDGFHTYGVLWTEQDIAWFADGQELRRVPTPAGAHVPLFWIINLAIGGRWSGEPEPGAAFPRFLDVASFRAWALAA